MKILYAGSPEASKKTLEILYNSQEKYGFKIAGVLSNPDTAKGRHKELIPTPVTAFAKEKGLKTFTPEHLDSAVREQIAELKPDLLVCFAYGHIFGPKFLAVFPEGGINLHPSDLPKYRGCTPVNAAILNRDKQMAVSIQKVFLAMDEGDILAKEKVELNGTENAESLLNFSAEKGAELILQIIKEAVEKGGKIPEGVPQSGEASYTNIIKKEDGKIDWKCSAEEIEAKIRAYYPNPGCWTIEKELPLRILQASLVKTLPDSIKECDEPGKVLGFDKPTGIYIQCGKGVLCVKALQRQGKNVMNYKDFMNGARDFTGSLLK